MMIQRLFSWIRRNKLTFSLFLIVLYFLLRSASGVSPWTKLRTATPAYQELGGVSDMAMERLAPQSMTGLGVGGIVPPYPGEAAPTTDVDQRLVVRETNLSLLVTDVRATTDAVVGHAEDQGGYMVSTFLTQPEEAPFATVVVRIPSDKLRESMEYFRSLALKVTSEYVSGRDVTDEFEDLEARLATLESTKAKFEEILERAVEINDILRVQRELINLQSQIDSLKGRQQLLEGTARLSRVTINMSTDEIALPYTPSETFRPAVIFKLAWRSLVRNLRKLAEAGIWLGVYALIWAPVLVVVLYIRRRMGRRKTN